MVPDAGTQLCLAVTEGNPRQLEDLLRRGADPNATGDREIAYLAERTPLWIAANLAGMVISATWIDFCNELAAALPASAPRDNALTHNRCIESARLLLEAGADTERICFGSTPLAQAVHACDVEMSRLLLAHGADPNARSFSPLSKLAKRERRKGPLGIMGYFNTPLHTAVERDSLELVNLLTSAGASVIAEDHEGKTPMDIARGSGNCSLLEALSSAR